MAFGLETLVLLGLVAYFLYRLGTKNHDYWTKRGVPGPKPHLFFGTQMNVIFALLPLPDNFKRLYLQYPDEPFVGLLTADRPTLLVRDIELIKHVLSKDFEYFPDRGIPYNEKANPLSGHLFSIEGVRWKNMRIKLTPTFTSGKIKRMFPLVLDCCERMHSVLQGPASRGEVVEFKDLFARITTDIIGTCAFGVDCNSVINPDAEFRRQGMKIFRVTTWSRIRNVILALFPKMTLIHKISQSPTFTPFFLRVIKENVEYREQNNIHRNDFLDLLIEIKNKGKLVDDKVDVIEDPFLKVPVSTSSEQFVFTQESLAAQAFLFFLAGFETSSATMSFCVIELAQHPEVQDKLRQEIDSVLKKHGCFSYDAVMDMKYMDMVVAETLRKYPPVPALARAVIKPYQVPNSKLVLEPGVKIYIPAHGLHYDPVIYPDPERFDPERFTPEAKASRSSFAYLPFGEGPRICIGLRFGLVQTKLGLASLLAKYELSPSPLTTYPVKFMKSVPVTTSAEGCHVVVTERRSPASAS